MDRQMLIDGADSPAEGGATFERSDPVTGDIATRAAAASVADAVRAADAAAAALPAWAELGPTARRRLLLKAADIMDGKSSDFASLMTAETGATEPWGRFNVMLAANML